MRIKKPVILLLSISLSILISGQELTSSERTLLGKLDLDYSVDTKNVSLNYAWLLYRSGNELNCRKADTVLNHVISLQDDDPESLTYGHWGWVLRDGEKFVDWNNALFQSHILFTGLWNEQGRMSAETQNNFIICCGDKNPLCPAWVCKQ